MVKTPAHWRNKELFGPRYYEFETPKDAFYDLIDMMLLNEIVPQRWGGPRANYTDILIGIRNPVNNIDLVAAGFKCPQRNTKFLKDYCIAETYRSFMSMVWMSQQGQSITYTVDNRSGHSLGPCLSSINFVAHPPYRMNVTSRTGQITPIGALDLSFGALTSQIASEVLQLDYHMPFIWTLGTLQFHVTEAAQILAYEGKLDWVEELAAKDTSWVAREVAKHWGYAKEHKQTAWKTFERAWGKARDRYKRQKEGTLHELGNPYYFQIPTHFWQFFIDGHNNAEQLEEKFGITRKWIRHRIRPFRALLHHKWGFNTPNTFDLVWSEDHPEYKVIQYVYHNGGSVESLYELCKALDLETEEEAQNYCLPYYQPYMGTNDAKD